MKITSTKFYCDICGKELNFPRYIYIKRKIYKINITGYRYEDVCKDCTELVVNYIRELKRGD